MLSRAWLQCSNGRETIDRFSTSCHSLGFREVFATISIQEGLVKLVRGRCIRVDYFLWLVPEAIGIVMLAHLIEQ